MTEDDVRRIVRDELKREKREADEAAAEFWRQHALEQIERHSPREEDGPLVTEIKEMFRNSANEMLGGLGV